MERPGTTAGLRHVALFVTDLQACERFYVDLIGMQVEWRPNAHSVYLTSGNDNLALHRLPADFTGAQRLDHIGFVLESPDAVDAWFAYLSARGVPMRSNPRTHRDGARSFYCSDPGDVTLQFIYHPPLAGNRG